jgi:carbamoylphosphate synthase small subunit
MRAYINPASTTIIRNIKTGITSINTRRVTSKLKTYGVSEKWISYDVMKTVARHAIKISAPYRIANVWSKTREITPSIIPNIAIEDSGRKTSTCYPV